MEQAAAYVRVSSRSQSLDTQRSAIRQAAGARGHDVAMWYEDTKTGRALPRPALDRLRSDVRSGLVGLVYLYRLDRLTRSGIRDTLATLDELRGGGARVVSIADGFDLSGPFADVVVAVIAWGAQMETLAVGERISAARQRVEAEGGSWGRPTKFSPTVHAEVLRLRAAGVAIRTIGEQLGIPKSTIHYMLSLSQNPGSKRGPKSLRKCAS